MSAVTPTLDQRLRFVDLTFECVLDAERELIDAGRISATKPYGAELPNPRGKLIAEVAVRMRREAMTREGLPFTLLPESERPVEMGRAA